MTADIIDGTRIAREIRQEVGVGCSGHESQARMTTPRVWQLF